MREQFTMAKLAKELSVRPSTVFYWVYTNGRIPEPDKVVGRRKVYSQELWEMILKEFK